MTNLRKTIPLKKRKIIKKSFAKVLAMTLFAVVLSLGYFSMIAMLDGQDPANPTIFTTHRTVLNTIWFTLMAILILWSPFYQYLYYLTYFYDMDENNVIIKKGVIIKKEITLPFAKITDVYVDQDFLDVLLGLYDVHISTPTVGSGVFAHIDGVNKRSSVTLRKLILDRINQKEEQPQTNIA